MERRLITCVGISRACLGKGIEDLVWSVWGFWGYWLWGVGGRFSGGSGRGGIIVGVDGWFGAIYIYFLGRK